MSVNCSPTLGPYDFCDVKKAVALRALKQSRTAAAPCNPAGFWLVSGFSLLCRLPWFPILPPLKASSSQALAMLPPEEGCVSVAWEGNLTFTQESL